MLDSFLKFSIHHRWVVVMAAMAVAVLGGHCLTTLNIDAVPDITNKQVQINTAVSGLAPVEIEKRVTFPIEWAMQGVPGVQQIRSVSFYGVSQVTLVFNDDVDLYRARQLVSERLSEVKDSLPPGVGAPFLGPIWTGLGEIFFWSVEAKGPKPDGTAYTATELRTIQDWVVKPRLRGVPGVTEINSIGGYERQYHVQPDPAKLLGFGLTLRDVVSALAENNANMGGGYIERSGEQYNIRSTGLIENVEDIKNVKLGIHDGIPIRVKDVATVGEGKELRTGASTVDGEEAVLGTAILLYGENGRMVSRRVADKLAEVGKALPENVALRTLYDRRDLIDATLRTVWKNLAEGALLVAAILLLLLGNVRAALIVTAAIPLSMLLAATGMTRLGVSGNLMSLGAIDFGIIVDGAVVMVENIVRRLSERQGELGRPLGRSERLDLTFDAAREVAKPTVFGVLIIMIVYLPILTLTGVEGKMFTPMAQVVLLAIGGALLLTFTVIPALAALALRQAAEREPLPTRKAKQLYAPVLAWALSNPWKVVLGAVAALALAAGLATRLGSEFIPKLGEGAIAVQPSRMPSIALTASVELQKKVEKALLAAFPDEIECLFARTGSSEVVTDICGPDVSDTYITLKPLEQWRKAKNQAELVAAMERVVRDIPGQNYEFSQPIELRMNELVSGVRADVAVKVFGEDAELLRQLAERAAEAVSTVRGSADVKVEQAAGLPVVTIKIDRTKIARHGLNVSDVQDVVGTALGGAPVGELMQGDRRFEIVVRLPDHIRDDLEAIGSLMIPLPADAGTQEQRNPSRRGSLMGFVPLRDVAEITVAEGARLLKRENGHRRSLVQCNVRGRDLGGFVEEARRKVERTLGKLPEGYWVEWGGQFENLVAAKQRLAVVVPVALLLIFILLFATFGNAVDSLLVFTGVPFALTGGITALWALGMPFSISAGVGFIALSGVAVLNGLVMVSFINRNAETSGPDLRTAIIQGSMTRLRPVLMTALVASLGFVPMAISTGMGAEVQRPLAVVVIGGIVSSTILTVVVLPVLYLLFHSRRPTDKVLE